MSPEYNFTDTHTDHNGYVWEVNALIKTLNGRQEILAISFTAKHGVLQQQTFKNFYINDLIQKFVFANNLEPIPEPDISKRGPHQGTPSSDEELQAVADAYIVAYSQRKRISTAVAKALGVTESTATKRIMLARKRGFLPPRRGVSPMEFQTELSTDCGKDMENFFVPEVVIEPNKP